MSFLFLHRKFSRYIKKPERIDCPNEIRKNGEKSVPEIRQPASDLKKHKSAKFEKFKFNEERITVFASPSLKNPRRGKNISAYENKSESEVKYAIVFLF